MDNFQRGDKALRALVAYRDDPADLDISDAEGITETGEHSVIVAGSPIGYLIADLLHVARRFDLSVEDVLKRGVTHYASDVIEQAWEHADDWHNCLQDPSNLERATAVMATADVPESVREDALRYVGLLPPLPRDEEA